MNPVTPTGEESMVTTMSTQIRVGFYPLKTTGQE